MSGGVGCRHSLDLMLLWLWQRLVATAPFRPLAWESPYVTGAALEKTKKKKRKRKNYFQVCLEAQKTQTSQSHPEKEKHSWRNQAS